MWYTRWPIHLNYNKSCLLFISDQESPSVQAVITMHGLISYRMVGRGENCYKYYLKIDILSTTEFM